MGTHHLMQAAKGREAGPGRLMLPKFDQPASWETMMGRDGNVQGGGRRWTESRETRMFVHVGREGRRDDIRCPETFDGY